MWSGTTVRCQANVLWRMQGSGPPGIAPDKRFDFEGCDIFLEFRDGKLAHYQGAYDVWFSSPAPIDLVRMAKTA